MCDGCKKGLHITNLNNGTKRLLHTSAVSGRLFYFEQPFSIRYVRLERT